MKTLIVTPDMFNNMISGLIQSGVTFEAIQENKLIKITFTNGY